MPFGLKNGPSTFQRAMLNVLEGQEEYSIVSIDDILIFFTVLGGPPHSYNCCFGSIEKTWVNS